MPLFTCVTEMQGSIEFAQVEAEAPDIALRKAIGVLPYDDCSGPCGKELDWLQDIASGVISITLHPVDHCKNTWAWLEGVSHNFSVCTYIIKTEV